MSTPRVPFIALGTALLLLVGCTAAPPGTTTTVPVGTPTTSTAPPATQGTYRILLRPVGGMDPGVRAVFDQAAIRWSHVITADVPDLDPGPSFTGCLGAGPTGVIHDLVIDVEVVAIDGPNGVLGSAGPCLSGSDGLPRAGLMRFDTADVATLMADGRFVQVVEHEMGHVLGLGTVWRPDLLSGSGSPDPRFTGPDAVAEWRALGGTGAVPVEATGGSGTAGAHWRESVFGNELMTGWLNPGSNLLSRMTIASFADLGYQVDLSQADPYSLPSALIAPLMRTGAPSAPIGSMELVTPAGRP